MTIIIFDHGLLGWLWAHSCARRYLDIVLSTGLVTRMPVVCTLVTHFAGIGCLSPLIYEGFNFIWYPPQDITALRLVRFPIQAFGWIWYLKFEACEDCSCYEWLVKHVSGPRLEHVFEPVLNR